MIQDILSSDVEFARGMMSASHPDAEILAHLASRGIQPAQAAQLVDDLRHGRQPNTLLPFPLRPGRSRRGAGDRPKAAPTKAPPEYHPHSKRSRRGKHQRSSIPWWFLILILIFLGALTYAFWEGGTHATREAINEDKHELPPAPGK
jgi:hypothetical protein